MMCPVSSSSAELVVEEQERVSALPGMFMLAGVTTMGGDWCGFRQGSTEATLEQP